MSRFNPAPLGAVSHEITPQAQQSRQAERSDKSEELAIRVLEIAQRANANQVMTATQLADYAETLWQWVTTDEWKP